MGNIANKRTLRVVAASTMMTPKDAATLVTIIMGRTVTENTIRLQLRRKKIRGRNTMGLWKAYRASVTEWAEERRGVGVWAK